jgi:type I restriction enzyme S subunit
MPDTWPQATLGGVATWFSGATPKAGQSEYYAGGTIPWATIGDLKDRPISDTATRLTEAGAAVIGRLAPVGAVLVSMYGTIGRTALAAVPMATNQAIAWGVPHDAQYSREFLFLVVQALRERLDSLGRGATQRNINRAILREQPVPVPPLTVQQRIVDLIGAADAHVTVLRSTGAALEQALRTVRREVLTPTPDWRHVPLTEVAEVKLGRMLSKERSAGAELHPYIRNANVQWDGLDLSDLKRMSFPAAERERYALRAGDILVCEGGDPGRSVLLRDDLPGIYYQKAIHRVRTTMVDPTFLYHWLAESYVTDAISDLCTNTTIKHLTAEKFRTLSVALPPTREQQTALASLLDGLLEVQQSMAQELKTLTDLRAVLLADLLSGDTAIPESYDALMLEAV